MTSPAPSSAPRPARGWLRENRLRIALLVGAVETIAVAFTSATWRFALLLAAVAFALYVFVGRRARNATVRDVSWTFAASQVLPAVVPVIIYAVGLVAIVAVVVLTVVVALMLYLDRR